MLDVGILLEKTQDLGRLSLYIPAVITCDMVQNLSQVLSSGNTLNAVFNDVVRQVRTLDYGYLIRRSDNSEDTVHAFDAEDYELDRQDDSIAGTGTVIAFRHAFCRRVANAPTGRSYVRFRISLPGAASNMFSSELQSHDRAFVSAVGELELTEFRLNERRSYPKAVAELSEGKALRIKTIHYFLIRDLERQLVMQHAPFEKVRRLEAGLWTKYLASMGPGRSQRVDRKLLDRLVIYHWKVKEAATRNGGGQPPAAPPGISDFVAFASFRGSTSHLIFYASMIVLLGATGSALAAAIAGFFGLPSIGTWRTLAPTSTAYDRLTAFGANVFIVFVLSLVISLVAYWRPVSVGVQSGLKRLSSTLVRKKIP